MQDDGPIPCFAAHQIDGFHKYLKARAEALRFTSELISLESLDPDQWSVTHAAIKSLKQFFDVIGVRAKGASSWTQPMLKTHGQGQVFLVTYDELQHGAMFQPTNDVARRWVLVRTMAEPGNIGYRPMPDAPESRVLVGPTMQASKGNRLRHPQLPLLEALDAMIERKQFVRHDKAVKDGGRFYETVNDCYHIGFRGMGTPGMNLLGGLDDMMQALNEQELKQFMNENHLLIALFDLPDEVRANFAWITIEVLRTVLKNSWANGHLRMIASMLL